MFGVLGHGRRGAPVTVLIRVNDGIAHWVGPIRNNTEQIGWYVRCTVELLRANQMTRLPLDAPAADFVTCLLCAPLYR